MRRATKFILSVTLVAAAGAAIVLLSNAPKVDESPEKARLSLIRSLLEQYKTQPPNAAAEKQAFINLDSAQNAPSPAIDDAQQLWVASAGAELDVRLFAGSNRNVLFVLTHGTPKSGAPRLVYDHYGYMATIRALYAKGDVAFIYRAGAGDSRNALSESYGDCTMPDYKTPTLNAAQHLIDVAQHLRSAQEGYRHIILLGQSSGGLATLAVMATSTAYDYGFAFNPGRGLPRENQWCDQSSLREMVKGWSNNLKRPVTLMFSNGDEQMQLPDAAEFYKNLPLEVVFYSTPGWGPAHPLMGLWPNLWVEDVFQRLGLN